ncbi:MAG: hypothetical protein NWP83_09945, partial [Spirosomaceae bacterium]|nr:hypothetical protein [Spirosomataceae bacterium]
MNTLLCFLKFEVKVLRQIHILGLSSEHLTNQFCNIAPKNNNTHKLEQKIRFTRDELVISMNKKPAVQSRMPFSKT